MHPSDRELIKKFKSGEKKSFTILVERYKSPIFSLARGMMGGREEAEDLSQEIFLKVYLNLSQFKGRSKFYTWLYRLAVNTCLNAQKKRARKPQSISLSAGKNNKPGDSPPVELIGDEANNPLKILENRELKEKIRLAINSLSQVLKATFILREIEDLSYKELGQVFNCSPGTIKSRLSRAREELRKKLILYI